MVRIKSYISNFMIVLIMVILTFAFLSSNNAQETLSSISGRVLNAEGQPVPNVKIGIKPVRFGEHRSLKQRTPFQSWFRSFTNTNGNFSFNNIDPVTSQLTLFPEHGSDLELHSIGIGDLTFYSIAFRRSMPTWFGKITFAVEPGEHLENVIVNVKEPRMRIRGRVFFDDGTPLDNAPIRLSIESETIYRNADGRRTGGSTNTFGRSSETDNEGYFVAYSQGKAATYTVSITYKEFTFESESIELKVGERYDDLVFVLKNMKNTKRSDTVWMVNPANGHAYKKIHCMSLEDAKVKAKHENAYLVSINDEAEQNWVESVFKEKRFFWIGLNVPKEKQPWKWNNGEPLTYMKWRKLQKPENITENEGTTGVALDFSTKKWIAISPNSPFLPAIKHAIVERD